MESIKVSIPLLSVEHEPNQWSFTIPVCLFILRVLINFDTCALDLVNGYTAVVDSNMPVKDKVLKVKRGSNDGSESTMKECRV